MRANTIGYCRRYVGSGFQLSLVVTPVRRVCCRIQDLLAARSLNVLVWMTAILITATGASTAQDIRELEPDRIEEFVALVAKNECRIANEAAEILLPAGGFSDTDEVRAIMAQLLYHGRARLVETESDGVLIIFDGPCPAGGHDADPKTAFLEIIAENGCSLTSTEGRAMLEDAGIHIQEVRAMLPLLQNDGTLSLSDDSETVMLTDEACNDYGPNPEVVTDLVNDPVTKPREALIEYLEIVGCELTYEDAKTDLPAMGFDFDKLEKDVQDYLAQGIVTVGPDETLILTIGRCS